MKKMVLGSLCPGGSGLPHVSPMAAAASQAVPALSRGLAVSIARSETPDPRGQCRHGLRGRRRHGGDMRKARAARDRESPRTIFFIRSPFWNEARFVGCRHAQWATLKQVVPIKGVPAKG